MQKPMEIAIDPPATTAVTEREFHQRFEAVRPRLLAICRAVVGSGDAEDLVQETYLRAVERLGQLRDPDLLEAWLARIALNESRSLVRRNARQRQSLQRLVPRDPPAGDRELADLVDSLPTRQRICLALYYGYGYRVAEIATLLDISEINARTVLYRARRRLRRLLQENRS